MYIKLCNEYILYYEGGELFLFMVILLIEYFYNVLNDCFYIEIGGILYFYMWYYDIYVYIGNIFNFKIMRCNKVWLVF